MRKANSKPHMATKKVYQKNNSDMEKVKIKRVKKNKKQITTSEKILAGIGVGSILLGGVSAVSPKTQTSTFVRTQTTEAGSNESKIKSALKNIFGATFGANQAKADTLSDSLAQAKQALASFNSWADNAKADVNGTGDPASREYYAANPDAAAQRLQDIQHEIDTTLPGLQQAVSAADAAIAAAAPTGLNNGGSSNPATSRQGDDGPETLVNGRWVLNAGIRVLNDNGSYYLSTGTGDWTMDDVKSTQVPNISYKYHPDSAHRIWVLDDGQKDHINHPNQITLGGSWVADPSATVQHAYTINPGSAEFALSLGATGGMTFTVTDENGNTVTPTSGVSVSSNDSSVAIGTFSNGQVAVRGVHAGNTSINIIYGGTSAFFSVKVTDPTLTGTGNPSAVHTVGEAATNDQGRSGTWHQDVSGNWIVIEDAGHLVTNSDGKIYKSDGQNNWTISNGDTDPSKPGMITRAGVWTDANPSSDANPSVVVTYQSIQGKLASTSWNNLNSDEQRVFTEHFSGGSNVTDIPENFSGSSAFAMALGWGGGGGPRTLNGKQYKFENNQWRVVDPSVLPIVSPGSIAGPIKQDVNNSLSAYVNINGTNTLFSIIPGASGGTDRVFDANGTEVTDPALKNTVIRAFGAVLGTSTGSVPSSFDLNSPLAQTLGLTQGAEGPVTVNGGVSAPIISIGDTFYQFNNGVYEKIDLGAATGNAPGVVMGDKYFELRGGQYVLVAQGQVVRNMLLVGAGAVEGFAIGTVVANLSAISGSAGIGLIGSASSALLSGSFGVFSTVGSTLGFGAWGTTGAAVGGATVIGAAVVGAIVGIQAVLNKGQDKVRDTKRIEGSYAIFNEIMQQYWSVQPRSAEEAQALHDAAKNAIQSVFDQIQFEKESSRADQQRWLQTNYFDGLDQNLQRWQQAFQNDNSNMTVYQTSDGVRIGSTGTWGQIRVSSNGQVLSWELNSGEAPPPSVIQAIMAKQEVTRLDSAAPVSTNVSSVLQKAASSSWDQLTPAEQQELAGYFSNGQHAGEIPSSFAAGSSFVYMLGWGGATGEQSVNGRTYEKVGGQWQVKAAVTPVDPVVTGGSQEGSVRKVDQDGNADANGQYDQTFYQGQWVYNNGQVKTQGGKTYLTIGGVWVERDAGLNAEGAHKTEGGLRYTVVNGLWQLDAGQRDPSGHPGKVTDSSGNWVNDAVAAVAPTRNLPAGINVQSLPLTGTEGQTLAVAGGIVAWHGGAWTTVQTNDKFTDGAGVNYNWNGSAWVPIIANVSSLPTTGNKVGDSRAIGPDQVMIWDGTKWNPAKAGDKFKDPGTGQVFTMDASGMWKDSQGRVVGGLGTSTITKVATGFSWIDDNIMGVYSQNQKPYTLNYARDAQGNPTSITIQTTDSSGKSVSRTFASPQELMSFLDQATGVFGTVAANGGDVSAAFAGLSAETRVLYTAANEARMRIVNFPYIDTVNRLVTPPTNIAVENPHGGNQVLNPEYFLSSSQAQAVLNKYKQAYPDAKLIDTSTRDWQNSGNPFWVNYNGDPRRTFVVQYTDSGGKVNYVAINDYNLEQVMGNTNPQNLPKGEPAQAYAPNSTAPVFRDNTGTFIYDSQTGTSLPVATSDGRLITYSPVTSSALPAGFVIPPGAAVGTILANDVVVGPNGTLLKRTVGAPGSATTSNTTSPATTSTGASITSLSVTHGAAGTSVTISGSKFNAIKENNAISFLNASGGVLLTVVPTGMTATSLTFTVPSSLPAGAYAIQVMDLGAYLAKSNTLAFTIDPSSATSPGTELGQSASITTDAVLPPATLGTVYNKTLATANVPGTVTWSVTAGSLPAGLTLNSTGLISGTPITAGTTNFVITATNGTTSLNKIFTLTVSPMDGAYFGSYVIAPSVELTKTSTSIVVGATDIVVAKVTIVTGGIAHTLGTVSALSSNPGVATVSVSSGNVMAITGMSAGTATITVHPTILPANDTSQDRTITVTVTNGVGSVTGSTVTTTLSLSKSSSSLSVGSTDTITSTVGILTTTNGANTFAYGAVTAVTGNSSIATVSVSSGNTLTITGVAAGTTILTVHPSHLPTTDTSRDMVITVTVTANGSGAGNGNGNATGTGTGSNSSYDQLVAQLNSQINQLQNQINNLSSRLNTQAGGTVVVSSSDYSGQISALQAQINQLSGLIARLQLGTANSAPVVNQQQSGLLYQTVLQGQSHPVLGASTTVQNYTVKKGDTLWAISKKYYGDGTKWRKILSANPDCLSRPGNTRTLKIGAQLVIPSL